MSGLYILFLITIPLGSADPNPLDEINIHFNIDDIENKKHADDYGGISGSVDNDTREGIVINKGTSVGEIIHYEPENEDRKDGQHAGRISGQGEPGVYYPMYEPKLGSMHGQGHTFGHIGNGGYNQYYTADYGDTRLRDSNGNVDSDSGSGGNDPLEGIVINRGVSVGEINNYEAENKDRKDGKHAGRINRQGEPRVYNPMYGNRRDGQNAGRLNGQGQSGVYDRMYVPEPDSIPRSGRIFVHHGNGRYNQYNAADYGDINVGNSNGNVNGDSGSGDNDPLEGIVINRGANVEKINNYEANIGDRRDGQNAGRINGQGEPRVYNPMYGDRRDDQKAGRLNGQGQSGEYDLMYIPEPGSIPRSGPIFVHHGNGRYNQHNAADYGDISIGNSNGNVDGDNGSGDNDPLETFVINSGAQIEKINNYEAKKGERKHNKNAGCRNRHGVPQHNDHLEGSINGHGGIFRHIGNGRYNPYQASDYGSIDDNSGSGDSDPLEGVVINSGACVEEIKNYEAKKGERKNGQNAGSINGQSAYGVYNPMYEPNNSIVEPGPNDVPRQGLPRIYKRIYKPELGGIHGQGGIFGHIGKRRYKKQKM